MDEFIMLVSGNTFHRLKWEYVAFTVSYLVLTHDGVADCHAEIGKVGIAPDGYWGEYNATGERFYSPTRDGAKMMVETAHSTYWRPIQTRTMYEIDTKV
jgi:hypothetical protein